VRNVAKYIGFAQFYSVYLHHFKLRITPLHGLTTKFDYTKLVATLWTEEAECAFCDIQSAILANPCFMRFDHQRLVVLCTDFSSAGFGFVVCQPVVDAASMEAMVAYRANKDFFFMTKESSVALQPITFGSRKCHGNKIAFTPILEKDSLAIGSSTRTGTCSLHIICMGNRLLHHTTHPLVQRC
jgi:hypothetical protein